MPKLYIREGATYNGDGTLSSVASGATVTITIASPGVVTWNGHGRVANDAVYFGTTGALPTGITAGTKYFVRNPTTNTFEISATSGGASINTTGTQSGTHTCTTPGAWNHLNIITGTAVNTVTGGTQGGGVLAAGDTVFIRSKDEGGANLALTATGQGTQLLGASAATTSSEIVWILDAGAVWAGISGTLSLNFSGGNYFNFRNHNTFISAAPDKIILLQTANYAAAYYIADNSTTAQKKLINWKIDTSVQTSLVGVYGIKFGSGNVVENMNVVMGNGSTAVGNALFNVVCGLGSVTFKNVNVSAPVATSSFPVVDHPYAGSGAGTFQWAGGSITGAGATSGNVPLIGAGYAAGRSLFVGVDIPAAMPIYGTASTAAMPYDDSSIDIIGGDAFLGGYRRRQWGEFDSRDNQNYPYLNATLPNSSATPWSWKLYCRNTAIQTAEVDTAKVYQSAAAQKKITLELNIEDNYAAALNKQSLWMTVSYVDNSTGLRVMESTRDYSPSPGALTASAATWLPDENWGAITCSPYKLTLTTAGSIKQDTLVIVTLWVSNQNSGNLNQCIFICPDFLIEAP